MAASRKRKLRRKVEFPTKKGMSKSQEIELSLEEAFLDIWETVSDIPLERQNLAERFGNYSGECEFTLDFANHDYKVIIEINGATHRGKTGGHSSGSGINRDYHKQNFFQLLGYKYFEFDSRMSKDEMYLTHISHCIDNPHTLPMAPRSFISYGSNNKKATAMKRALAVIPDIHADYPLTSKEWKKEIDDIYSRKYKRKYVVSYSTISEALSQLGFVKKNLKLSDTKGSRSAKRWIKESNL
jgi:very-short-patch-repair endonuclease